MQLAENPIVLNPVAVIAESTEEIFLRITLEQSDLTNGGRCERAQHGTRIRRRDFFQYRHGECRADFAEGGNRHAAIAFAKRAIGTASGEKGDRSIVTNLAQR